MEMAESVGVETPCMASSSSGIYYRDTGYAPVPARNGKVFSGREEVPPESVASGGECWLQGGKLRFAERLFDAPADAVLAGNLPVPHAGRRHEHDDVGVDKRIEPGVLQRL